MTSISTITGLVALLSAVCTPLLAQDLRELSASTSSLWLHGATAEDLAVSLAQGSRITDLEVESASPLRFSAALVRNDGAYASPWWWYQDQTAAQIDALLLQNQARLIDLEPYEVSGQTRFACVMVPNTGADAKAWWWYHGKDAGFISLQTYDHIARLIDLDRYQVGGQFFYSAIMIANAGSDARGWWWFRGVSAAAIDANIERNGSRVYDIERRGDGSYDAILILDRVSIPHWSWWPDLSETELQQTILDKKERIIDIETEIVGGLPRFTVALISNEAPPTSGSLISLGSGCGSSVPLRQSALGLPRIGSSVTYQSHNAAPSDSLFLILGFSAKSWNDLALPLDLSMLGAPGCTLYTRVDKIYAASSDAAGNAELNLPIPNDPGLVGSTFYTQFVALDSTANALGLTTSNALAGLVGTQSP